MIYSFTDTIEAVEERFENKHEHGIGKEALFSKHHLGWFIRLRRLKSTIFIGDEHPELFPNDTVKISISKVINAKP